MVPGHATAFTIYKGLPVSDKYEYITIYDSSDVEIRDLTNEVFTDLVNEIVITVPEEVFLTARNLSSTRNLYLKLMADRVDLIEPGETKRYSMPKDEPISATFDYCDFYWDAECTKPKAAISTEHVMTETWGWALNPDKADYFIWNATGETLSAVYTPVGGTEDVLTIANNSASSIQGNYEAYLSDAISDIKVYVGDYETDPTSCFLYTIIKSSAIYMDENKEKAYREKNVGVISVADGDGTGEGVLKVMYVGEEEPEYITLYEGTSTYITDDVAEAGDALSTVYDTIEVYDADGTTPAQDLKSETITGLVNLTVTVTPPTPPDPEEIVDPEP